MSDIANQLRIVLTDLITTQSEGEWDDGLIASDVEQFLPPILATVQAALDAAEARERQAVEALRWAHDTLYEINPSNYDHDEVCRLNDASVEVILGLAPMLGETHGKSAEWWAEQVAAAIRTGAKP